LISREAHPNSCGRGLRPRAFPERWTVPISLEKRAVRDRADSYSDALRAASNCHTMPAVLTNGFITDVNGLRVGHFTDSRRPTGCTVVLCEAGAVTGVDVRGSAPGTRETDLLDPTNTVEKAHAILLSGGSAFGLDAASGVMRYLEEHGIGFPTRFARV